MLQTIIDKFEAEMEKDKDNRMLRIIAEHIEGMCRGGTLVADRVTKALEDGKTLKGALEAMRKEAEKNMTRNGNVGAGILPDAEGYAIMEGYFGIDGGDAKVGGKPSEIVSVLDLLD